MNTPKNTICLWFEKDALAAAEFYAATFPDSKVGGIFRAPSDFPSGKAGNVLTVEFTVVGIPGSYAKRAFDAMMTMQKIDVAVIDAARRG